MARVTGRGATRTIAMSVCALAIAGLVAAIVRQSYGTNSAAAEVVSLEADGAEILHPMTTLLGELVEAQSAAVLGQPVDAVGVRDALTAVARIDGESGEGLRTSQRLTNLTADVEAALKKAPTAEAAYDTYSGLVRLAVDLMRSTGDSSHLVHDPDLDSFYLMDAAIVRLPNAIVYAGRAADLVALARGGALVGEDAIRAAVARFGVSAAAEDVSAGLTKSLGFTARSELGTNIAERLDAFKAAADAFAPPTMLGDLSTAVDAATLGANARRVYAAALPLAHRLLAELQALLEVRRANLAAEWRFTLTATGVAGLLAIVIVWMLAIGRPHRRVTPDEEEPSLTDARSLLDSELVHVGRSDRHRARRRGDAL